MTSKVIKDRLAALGFQYDEDVTFKTHYWSGTIDPIGKFSIDGDCRGIVVSGDTRAQMDTEALDEALAARDFLEPCTDPECDMHGDGAAE